MASHRKNLTEIAKSNAKIVLTFYGAWVSSSNTFIALAVSASVLTVLGIMSNVIVCYVMHRTKAILKNLSNFFIFCLAFQEVIFRVVIFPLSVVVKLPSTARYSPAAICELTNFLSAAWCSAAFCCTSIIALDRHNNIVSPLKSRTQKHNPFIVLILLWLYVTVFSLPFVFSASWVNIIELSEASDELLEYLGEWSHTRMCDLSRGWIGPFSTTIYFVFSFLVPIVVISTAYVRIVACLSTRTERHQIQTAATKSKRKAIRMLILVVLGFVLCWGPKSVVSVLRSYHVLDEERHHIIFVVTMLTEMMMYSSSIVNPFLYAYYNGEFRKQITFWCGRWARACKPSSSLIENSTDTKNNPICLSLAGHPSLEVPVIDSTKF